MPPTDQTAPVSPEDTEIKRWRVLGEHMTSERVSRIRAAYAAHVDSSPVVGWLAQLHELSRQTRNPKATHLVREQSFLAVFDVMGTVP